MGLVDDLRMRFERIEEETRKAASYLAVSRAAQRVPGFAFRVANSDCREAMFYVRNGCHMAFVVTLAATYEKAPRRITIPNLIAKLGDRGVQHALATDRGLPRASIEQEVKRADRAFERICRLPIHRALKSLRDNVVAHHGEDIDSHGSTMGPLNRLMIRTVVLVDHIGRAVNGEATPNEGVIFEILQQAKAFWAHGMDADVFGDLNQIQDDAPQDSSEGR